jgi:hypothetical protein
MSRPIPPDSAAQNPTLLITLELTVPLHITQMRDWTPQQREAARAVDAEIISAHGDDLQYGGRHYAAASNATARGLALLAEQPGGVDFAGRHWCTHAHPDCPNTPHHPQPA